MQTLQLMVTAVLCHNLESMKEATLGFLAKFEQYRHVKKNIELNATLHT